MHIPNDVRSRIWKAELSCHPGCNIGAIESSLTGRPAESTSCDAVFHCVKNTESLIIQAIHLRARIRNELLMMSAVQATTNFHICTGHGLTWHTQYRVSFSYSSEALESECVSQRHLETTRIACPFFCPRVTCQSKAFYSLSLKEGYQFAAHCGILAWTTSLCLSYPKALIFSLRSSASCFAYCKIKA